MYLCQVFLKCNKCQCEFFPHFYSNLHPPDNQTGSSYLYSGAFGGLFFINTPLKKGSPVLVASSFCQLPFSISFMLLTCLDSLSLKSFPAELVLCPFYSSVSALWFPAVSSRHQLTFSSVFRMTTNSGSRQTVSVPLSNLPASQLADSCCILHQHCTVKLKKLF